MIIHTLMALEVGRIYNQETLPGLLTTNDLDRPYDTFCFRVARASTWQEHHDYWASEGCDTTPFHYTGYFYEVQSD